MTPATRAKVREALADKEACVNCRFWLADTENSVRYFGLCRRKAPITVRKQSSCATWFGSGWPESEPGDWCGEFQALALLDAETTHGQA